MRCRSCMTVNPTGNRFCENCGKQLQLACARCGHDVNLLARFCGNCGSALIMHAPAPVRDTPKWGELKQATVLFADVVGSTDLVAHLDPEQAMARLRPAVLRMRHSVERFGGTVLRTLGDGVMAMFGVPRALEGHALLACQAALHMQVAFNQGGDGLQIRVGLHSGQVASDPEDAEDGRGGGAHGVTIHVASRVIALARPGDICLTEACRSAAGPGCQVEAIGEHQLKGIPQPMNILRLAAADGSVPHRGPTATSTFRGREGELGRLVAALGEARAGRGRVVGVAGDPGAGKSRLCQEFAQLCAQEGVPVHEVRAQLYGHALPLQPVLELFRVHFFGLAPTDGAATARGRIDACFAPVTSSESDLQLLHEFFGVASAQAAALALGPRARQARLLALARSLMRHQAGLERVIMIEDLHWLDEASEEFVSALVEGAAGTRTLLLLNYRGAYRAPWTGVPYFEQIDLAELGPAEMDALVAELLAPVTALPEVCWLVCRRASGNPFFAEELVRTLAESGLFAPDTGLPSGGLEAVERALPATIEAVIGARLDRVGEPEKTLLQMCAIIGKEIPLAVLEDVASPLASQIQVGLEGLCRAGLILPQRSEGGRHFAFRHPLIQEVAYSTQLKVRREQVHASVAAAMELYYAEQLDEYAGLIAYHFEQAKQALKAAQHNARAAAWVGSSSAAQAIKHWRKVRELLQLVPRSAEVDRLRATAGGKIALLGWRQGLTMQEVKPLIDDAIALASEVEDRLVPWLLTIEGRMLVASGGSAEGYVDCVKKALLYIDVDRDPGRVALANAFLSQACAWAGRLDEALHANGVALANAHEIDAYDRDFMGFNVEQWIQGVRLRLLVRMGRFDDARACLAHIAAAKAIGGESEMPVPGMAEFGEVELAWALDDRALAQAQIPGLARLVAQHESAPYVHAFVLGYSAQALLVAGQHQDALRSFERALALIRDTGAAREFETEVLAGTAECHLALGQYEAARLYATQGIELSRARATRAAECRALITRGATALAVSTIPADAEIDFANAERLIRETGAVGWERKLAAARGSFSPERAV